MLDDYLGDVNAGHNIIGTVYIETQAFARPDGPEELRPVGEVEFANGVAAIMKSGVYGPCRVAAAMVGFADMTLGDRVAATLDATSCGSPPSIPRRSPDCARAPQSGDASFPHAQAAARSAEESRVPRGVSTARAAQVCRSTPPSCTTSFPSSRRSRRIFRTRRSCWTTSAWRWRRAPGRKAAPRPSRAGARTCRTLRATPTSFARSAVSERPIGASDSTSART